MFEIAFRVAAGKVEPIGWGKVGVFERTEKFDSAIGFEAAEVFGIEEVEGGIAGDEDGFAGRRCGGRIGRRWVWRGVRGDVCGSGFEDRVEVEVFFDVAGCGVDGGGGIGGIEPKVAGRDAELVIGGQVTEGFYTGVLTRFLQEFVMRIGIYKIKDDSGDVEAGVKILQTIEQGGGGIGHGFGVEHQDDRKFEQPGEIGAAALSFSRSVEEPHDAFGDSDIGIDGMPVIELFYVTGAHHVLVEVDALTMGGGSVVDGINVIRSAFERLDGKTLFLKGAKETQRERCFACAAVGGCDEKLRSVDRHYCKTTIFTVQHGIFY